MSDTDNKAGVPFDYDGSFPALMRAAAEVFGDRVSAIRTEAIYGDRVVKTEVLVEARTNDEAAA